MSFARVALLVAVMLGVVVGLASGADRSRHGRSRHGHHMHKTHRRREHAEAEAEAEAAKSELISTEGGELGRDEAFSLILEKSAVSDMERSQFLMMLKAVRATLVAAKGDPALATSLLQASTANEPLQMQVLSEKRLATYFGKIQIGQCVDGSKTKSVECEKEAKRKMTFKALFDTGSCEFWMPNEGCMNNEAQVKRCQKHTLYKKSPTFINKVDGAGPFNEDQKMCIQYLSGKIEGFMARDTVRVGAFDVYKQVFGMADQIDVPLLDEVVWDGIVGLAYPNEKLKKQGVVPLFDNMMSSGKLQNNVFSYYIGSSSGAVTFGGVDPAYFTANDDKFRYAIVTEKSYWTIEIMDVELQFGGNAPQSTGVCKRRPKDEGDPDGAQINENDRCKAIVDTGTYLIYGPRESVTSKLSSLALNDGCASIGNLPKVTFVFWAGENQKPARLTLQPHDYTLEFIVPKQAYGAAFLEEDEEANSGLRGLAKDDAFMKAGVSMGAMAKARSLQRAAHKLKKMGAKANDCNSPENRRNTDICQQDCVIGIGPDNDPGWTLGQVFLRSFYTVFDRDTDRVGFVRSNPRGDIEKAQREKSPMPPKPLYGSLATSQGVVTDSL